MKKPSLGEKLEALAQGEERSQIGRLRGVLEQVERALEAGVPRRKILETLHEEGFTFTLRSFDSALRNLRKEKKEKGTVQATPPSQAGSHAPKPSLPIKQASPPPASPTTQGESSISEEKKEEYRQLLASLKGLPMRERIRREQEFFNSVPGPRIIK